MPVFYTTKRMLSLLLWYNRGDKSGGRRVAADSGNVPLQIPPLMLLQYSKDSETAGLHKAVIYKTGAIAVCLTTVGKGDILNLYQTVDRE